MDLRSILLCLSRSMPIRIRQVRASYTIFLNSIVLKNQIQEKIRIFIIVERFQPICSAICFYGFTLRIATPVSYTHLYHYYPSLHRFVDSTFQKQLYYSRRSHQPYYSRTRQCRYNFWRKCYSRCKHGWNISSNKPCLLYTSLIYFDVSVNARRQSGNLIHMFPIQRGLEATPLACRAKQRKAG